MTLPSSFPPYFRFVQKVAEKFKREIIKEDDWFDSRACLFLRDNLLSFGNQTGKRKSI